MIYFVDKIKTPVDIFSNDVYLFEGITLKMSLPNVGKFRRGIYQPRELPSDLLNAKSLTVTDGLDRFI